MTVRLTSIRAEKLFDGVTDRPFSNRTVVVEDGKVGEITSGDPALPADAMRLETPLLAPGFIDLQINGANDVLFNDDPTPDGIAAIAAAARKGGVAYILPTFITAKGQAYRQAIDAVARALDDCMPGVLGLHLEGPFFSPARPGIHDVTAIRRIEAPDLECLTAGRSGVRLITLAPEEQPSGTVDQLTKAG